MKTIYLSLFFIFLLFSCSSPQKLLEEGKYLKAHQISLQKLKQRKIKQEYIYTLEAAYILLSDRYQLIYEEGKARREPASWPRIFDRCLEMYDLQNDTKQAENRLLSEGYQPQLSHLPVKDWVEEARLNSAIYYYSLAQEHIPSARSGHQLAARQAFAWLKKSRHYINNFRDTRQLSEEMYDLGTTHILLNSQVDPFQIRLESSFFNILFARNQFPLREDWQVFHLMSSTEQRIDYDLELYFTDSYVSSDDCSTSCCSNSEEVLVGYKEIEVWNEKDSAYVVEKEPIYETISITITTYDQSKYSQINLNYVYRDRETGQEVHYKNNRGICNWGNTYTTYCGDPEAASLLCSIGGVWSPFPSYQAMLTDAVRSLRRSFRKSFRLDIEKHLFHTRPPQ